MPENEHNLYATLKRAFSQLDANADGRVCLSEFRPIYERLNPLCEGQDVQNRFMSIDTDSNGTISLDEMAAYYGFNADTGELNDGPLIDQQIIELMHLSSLTSQYTNERRIAAMKEAAERDAPDSGALVSTLVHSAQTRLSLADSQSSTATRRSSIAVIKLAGGAVLEKTIKAHAKTAQEHEYLDSCALGDFARTRALLAQGVEPCVACERGEGPLHKLARIGSGQAISTARQLLEAGVDVNLQDLEGKTAAHYAAEYAHANMLAWLFAMGADPEAISIEGWTVLHQAVFKADRRCVELLVNMYQPKIDVNAQDTHARTSLHIAAYRADEQILQLLLNHGADPTLEDEMSLRPANLAARSGRRSSQELLVSAGGPPSPERRSSLDRRNSSSESFKNSPTAGRSPSAGARRQSQTLAQLQAEHARKKAEDASKSEHILRLLAPISMHRRE